MTDILELDDLKTAWQSLDRKLDLQNALLLDQAREKRFNTLGRRLLPLRFGKVVQMLFGGLLIWPAVMVWPERMDGSLLFWSAIAMHVYGVALIALGGIMHGKLSELDRGESVLENQKRLAQARRFQVLSGIAVGLPWWFIWVPCSAVIAAAVAGIDIYANAPGPMAWMFAVGVAGWVLSIVAYRWAMQKPQWSARMERSAAGRSFERARKVLDELEAFERG